MTDNEPTTCELVVMTLFVACVASCVVAVFLNI